jgi:peroxiredoxin
MFKGYFKMPNKIKLGDKAPDFTLPDTNSQLRSLREFAGHNVILAFFVSCFTSVCTKEMCAFRDSAARLTNWSAQVIGISVNDQISNKAFAERNKLGFPILSDNNCEVINLYGIKSSCFIGSEDCTVILDKNGVVRYLWTTDNPAIEPDYYKIEQVLKKIG